MLRFALPLVFLVASCFGQHPVDPAHMYHRIWATVPMVGTGKAADPFRPMFLPNPAPTLQRPVGAATAAPSVAAAARNSILSARSWVSDDGKTALVELVAVDRSAFSAILNSRLPGVKVFERGKNTKDEVELEFKKFKKDFAFDDRETGRAR